MFYSFIILLEFLENDLFFKIEEKKVIKCQKSNQGK